VEVGYIVAIIITLLVNWGRYGSPLRTGYEGEHWELTAVIGLAGSLFSPGRGILWEFPAIVLTPFGVRALLKTEHRPITLALVALVGAQLLNAAGWYVWWGGWDY